MMVRTIVACLAGFLLAFQAQGILVNINATIKLPETDVKSLPLTPEMENPYFKILNELDGKIYIGGKKQVVIYDPEIDIINSMSIIFPEGELTNFIPCKSIAGEDADKICQHYIRVAERINSTDFLFCGTNRLEPYCHYVKMENNNYTITESFSAQRQVQLSVVQNSTSLYYDNGLFTGYNIESGPNPSHIARYLVSENELAKVATTDDQNANFVNEPDFVGKPYVDGKFMYFFYRETAVEAVNQGKFVYSRVGRLCLDDTGHNKEFQTFFKARLNCSLQGEYPFYFDHIQDVIVEERNGDVIFYAVFTTTPHGPASSAVCSYRLTDIKNVFATSKFKGKEANKLPGPVERPDYDNKFEECLVNELSGQTRTFQETNTLMDDLVPNYNLFHHSNDDFDPPLLYSTGMNFYSIAVDSGNEITFVGTESGTILQTDFSNASDVQTFEMEILNITYPVTGLRHHGTKLLAVTAKGLYQIELKNCASGCRDECEKFRHSYCNCTTDSIYNDGSVQILSSASNITSCVNRNVELTCEAQKTSPFCGDVALTWYWSMKGEADQPLVTCNGNDCQGSMTVLAPFVQYQVISNQPNYKLVHLTVTALPDTEGMFICEVDENTNATVQLTLDKSNGCLTRDSYNERMENRMKLKEEKDAVSKCQGNVDATKIMFQECDKCPGDPRVNV